MKLIIQIPCFNEAASLPVTLAALPREVPGFESVEWLIIDDGSSDGTADIAKKHGVDHVVRFAGNRGLARAFMAGLHASLSAGADVIVNTDADNQYQALDIPKLVAPIVSAKADMTIGARPIRGIAHFSPLKKLLQAVGSGVVRSVSGVAVDDAPSGFRAMNREAALRFNVFNSYTYTLETIIQAGKNNLAVVSVPVRVNPEMRPSRLMRGLFSYVGRSFITIFRIFAVYQPFRFFLTIGVVLFVLGLLPGVLFLYEYIRFGQSGHIQSLILSAILIIMGVQAGVLAFVGDLLAVNRTILEEMQFRSRKRDLESAHHEKHNFRR